MVGDCDNFYGMNVRETLSVARTVVYEVHHGEQVLSDPYQCRDDAIAYMFYLKNAKGTPTDPLRD